jgi:hypothetical protein
MFEQMHPSCHTKVIKIALKKVLLNDINCNQSELKVVFASIGVH